MGSRERTTFILAPSISSTSQREWEEWSSQTTKCTRVSSKTAFAPGMAADWSHAVQSSKVFTSKACVKEEAPSTTSTVTSVEETGITTGLKDKPRTQKEKSKPDTPQFRPAKTEKT